MNGMKVYEVLNDMKYFVSWLQSEPKFFTCSIIKLGRNYIPSDLMRS